MPSDVKDRSDAWLGPALLAVPVAAWLAAACLGIGAAIGAPALAAEVDAVGVPAPVGFADVVARVKSAVVGVRVKIEGEVAPQDDPQQQTPSSPGSPFHHFFHHFGSPMPNSPAPESGIALGSGFFVSGDGYVVTNNHVVAHGTSFEVTTDSGKTYAAKIIGTDPQTDLALIKISGTDLPYVRLAAEPPRVGDWVLAVGNPFGLGGTVTAGIVSARGRDIGAGPYDDFIQIDAPVNKGNSGGPSFNVKGEVIGVNTAIFSPSGGSVGVAFDIPAETVKLVVQQLRDKGHVTRGWIGVQIQPVTPEIAEAMGLKSAEGALVAEVQPNAPAARAGIETGDVITSVNGEAVKDSRDLARKIAALAPGTAAKLGILHNGQEKTVTVTLGELPREGAQAKAEEQKAPSEVPALGVVLAPASAVAGAGNQGVVITGIDPNGRAAEAGLQPGDIILEVARHSVSTPADVRKLVNEAREQSKRAVLLRVKRGDTTSFVAVPLA